MSTTNIRLKRSAVKGKSPTTEQLQLGELAINTVDGVLYFKQKDSDGVGGAESIIALSQQTSISDNTITLSAGSGLSDGGSFTLNQGSSETINFEVDSSKIVTIDTNQSISGAKTFTNNVNITKTSPVLTLKDTNTAQGNYPRIDFDTNNSQGVSLEHNEFDADLPLAGYGLVLKPAPSNTQAGSGTILTFVVQGEIYAGDSDLANVHEVWHAGNDGPSSGLNADLLDGQEGTYYLNYNNFSNTPTIGNATITLNAGAGLSFGGAFTTNQTSNETISFRVDSAKIATVDTNQSITGTKTFSNVRINALVDNRLYFNGGASASNIDHIWYNDANDGGAPGTYNFVADGTAGSTANAALRARNIFLSDSAQITQRVTTGGLRLTNLSNQATEATAVMINGSNVVGTRELGSNAFQSLNVMTTDTNQSVSGVKTLNNLIGIQFNHNGTGTASKLYRAGGNATRFEYYNNSFIFDAKDDAPWEIRTSNDSDVFQVDPTSDRTQSTLDFWGNVFRMPNLQNQASISNAVVWNSSGGGLGYRALGSNAFTSTSYAPIASPTFTGIVTTPDLTLTDLANQASEATALVINGSNVVGTRELGSNAFQSLSVMTTNTAQTVTGLKTFQEEIRHNDSGGTALRVRGGNSNTTLTRVTATNIASNSSDYGFTVIYEGALSGNDNAYVIYADNQLAGAQIESLRIKQDGNVTLSQDVLISGNLTVSGTTTTVNSEEVNIADNIILLNSNHTGAPSQNAGIAVERGSSDSVSVEWNETSDRWTFTNNGTDYYNIPISSEYTNNTGTVTSVSGGNGLTGSVTTSGSLAVGQGDGISVTADAVAVDTTVVRTSGNQTIGGNKTFSSDIALSTTGTTIGITFNQTTATDAGVDWGIRVNGEHLEFYEPEQSDLIHFSILDDQGVSSRYGYRVNGTMALDSNRDTTFRNISGSGSVTLSGLATQASETTALVINGSNVVGTRDLGSNAFTSTSYAPIASPTFTGIVTTPDLTLTGLSAQTSETTVLTINGSNVVGTRDLGSNAFNSTSYLPLAGGTMTGNITFSDDQEGIVWSRNTDGAYIKFFNTGDGDANSRLEYATNDNGTEYHRWVHFTPGSTEHELMTLRYSAGGFGDMNLTGNLSVDSDITVSGKVTSSNITLTGLANKASEATALVIDGSNIVGTRELGTLAFSSATYDNYSSWTLSADGGANQTISSGNTVDIAGGTYITTTASATDTVTIAHDNTTRSDTTSTASPAHGATFTAVDGVTTNAQGHITAINVKTVTLPSDNNTDTLQSIANDTTAADRFVTFVNSASGAQTGGSNAGLKFNPSTQDLTVGGKLSATTKSFDIPHPSKEGMRLRYGSLEGPENGVYVRGRLNGDNVIHLPDYWLQLVDLNSITVNLTPIGRGEVWVEEMLDNKITVGGNTNCFYHVYAERVDVEKLVVEYRV